MAEERVDVKFVKPRFNIGQKIYVPERNRVLETTIYGYEAIISEENGNLLGGVSGYSIEHLVSIRRGSDSDITNVVRARDFYEDKDKAKEASKFLEVKVDEETWKIAIGDREAEDENSPYNLQNCNLSICCADISEARDILIFCRKYNGLIAHDRNELADLVNGHGFNYDTQSPIGRIFEKLEIVKGENK